MRTIHVGLISSVLLAGALLCAGCANVVTLDEETNEDSLEQNASPRAPGEQAAQREEPAASAPAEDKKPKPDACITGEVGDGVTCQDTGLMKSQAYAICMQAELDLAVYDVNNNGCVTGSSRRAEYTCCGAAGDCITGEISEEVLCQEFSALHAQAGDACAKAGLQVTDVRIDNEGCQYLDSTRARYACCPSSAPSP